MRTQITTIILLACAGFFTLQARAQQQQSQQPDPQTTMQQFRDKMMQNMQAKGIDPQQFFSDIRDKMQSGTMDTGDIQKMMIDKGIIDQQMVTDMQSAMQSATLSRIKDQLAASDDEWKVIQPKIMKVLAASAGANQTPAGRGMAGFMGLPSGNADKAMKDLRTTVNDPHASPETIGLKLQAWRDAHQKAKADLAAAEKDLVDVLTVRQEATLMQMGLIQ